jgi:nicotinate-nucleotide pyrophosphorylase (carboxylating)
MFLPHKILEEKLLKMLAEDIGQGDITTALIVPSQTTAEAEVIAKASGVVAGIEEARILLESLELGVENLVADGEEIKPAQVLLRVSGDARTILSCERTLLNILSRMSGIATTTRKLTQELRKAKLKTKIACTRKTAPGLLYFDKKAVLVGGGDTHRLHLDDMILIKENHIAVAGSIERAVKKAREEASFSKKIEVEVTKIAAVPAAIKAGADIIMLDNFPPKLIEKVQSLIKRRKLSGKVLLEASGGIKSDNVLGFAQTGVDVVSLGEITNSAKALDISLEITRVCKRRSS